MAKQIGYVVLGAGELVRTAVLPAFARTTEHARLVAVVSSNRTEAQANLSWERVTTRYLSIYNGVQRRVPARRALSELPSNTW